MTEQSLTGLLREAIQRTREHLARAAAHYGVPAPSVEIRFDLRGQAAGQVRFARGHPPLVRFNAALLRENGERFLSRTVPHEAAHVIAWRLHGGAIRPHGPEWKEVMAVLGADSSRCHEFTTAHLKTRRLTRYHYHCACREHALTSIRHNRIQAGQTYRCRACGQTLEPGKRTPKREA